MSKHSRKGSVYLIVLTVLVSAMGLVAAFQQLMIRRTRELEHAGMKEELRVSLLLGLQESMRILSEDRDLTVDGFSDEWMKPALFQTDRGVDLRIEMKDAHCRFNLNHLSLPVSPSMPVTWMEVFQTLTRNAGWELDSEVYDQLQAEITRNDIWFENPDMLRLLLPETAEISRITSLVTSVPRPQTGPLPLNINTVEPEVLDALLGDSMKGWVDTVIVTRENEPVRELSPLLQLLPAPVQPLLISVLDVRSEYVTTSIVARKNTTEQTLTALLKRNGENVEVLRCLW